MINFLTITILVLITFAVVCYLIKQTRQEQKSESKELTKEERRKTEGTFWNGKQI